MNHTVLLIDDEPNVLEALRRALRREPYAILTATSADEAATLLADHVVDLIVCDEEMPGMSGTEFLAAVARDYPDIVRIMLTGRPSLPTALRAINEGHVYQFFTKPCNEIDLAISIRRALEQKELAGLSRELLDVSRRQCDILEKAQVLRRLREPPPAKYPGAAAGATSSTSLLSRMEAQIRRAQSLLEDADDEADDAS